ncbi:beta-N-acetylhexosaminidase [Saccharicrinis sp. GN24d3]|uniref:beta-N-acetylhexosaminidase n=1 Tax=Saccharicrinis sp. GN24d3 TaxID=3458416 RepID=UPI00403637A2
MKKIKLLILLICLVATAAMAQNINIVPQVLELENVEGHFVMTSKTKIVTDESNYTNAIYLQEILGTVFIEKLNIKKKGKKGLVLKLEQNLMEELGEEGYLLKIGKEAIHITAPSQAGVFYGIQSLRQMLPVNQKMKIHEFSLSAVEIKDKPRFSWRSFMLDEARYFKGMEQVKKLLDQMALLKMNVFHWHLTDDQGWRIEIKKYPELTEIGSYRSDSQIGGWDSKERSGKAHSGFYTQEQIKEIIAYATQRQITIVPEIEMPGHASAAIAAYPWLGTIGELKEVPVVFGKLPDSYDVTNPKVYEFIEDVLSEVMALFPGKTVHIGGDEVKFGAWKESEKVQEFMKKNGLGTPADLQIFFTNKVSNFIDKKEHRMMGWNEILGGNVHEWQKAEDVEVKEKLATSAIIHFWKGNLNLVKEAVINGYDIVNSHHIYTYLDYSHNYIPIEKAYAFDPIPEGLDEKFHAKVLGSGCQMWGEWIPEISDMDRMIFPRLAAYAEVGWTAVKQKNFEVFRSNLERFIKEWKKEGINCAEKFDKEDFKL